MKLKRDILVRTTTPKRAAEILKTHEVVDSYVSKHSQGRLFAERIWPLLQRHIDENDSVGIEEILNVCNLELQHLKESALQFCEEAFRVSLLDVSDEVVTKEYEKAWRFKEMAEFLNEQSGIVNTKFLDWVYFTWNEEFAYSIIIDEDTIDLLIEEIDAEAIKDTRHNRDYFGYGGGYLDLPEWLAFIAMYLEDDEQYERLYKMFIKLKYPPLQDALAYRLQRPETFIGVLNYCNNSKLELGLILLMHWYKQFVREGGTLRGYDDLESDHPLAKDGQKQFEIRETEIASTIKNVMISFCEFLGRNVVERWYYGSNQYSDFSDSYAKDSVDEANQLIDGFFDNTFTVKNAMTDFANPRYLVFLARQCEKQKEDALLDCLEKGYNTLLFSLNMHKLPQFGDELLEIYRGYTLPLQMRGTYKQAYKILLKSYLTRHEGLGTKITDDYNKKVAREVFVMSALMLMTEDDDLLECDRKAIYEETVDLLFRQINSCWMPHLQEMYVDALKMAYVMVCQVWKEKREWFEMRLARSVENMYWIGMVLSVGDGKIGFDTAQIVKKRWKNEHLVMYIRTQQIHEMNLYEWMKKWVEAIEF